MIQLSGQTREQFASKLDGEGIPAKIRKNMRQKYFPVPQEKTLADLADRAISFRYRN